MIAPVVELVWFTWYASPVIVDGTLTTKLTSFAFAPPTLVVAKAKVVALLTGVLTFRVVDIIMTSADGVALAEIVNVLTVLIGAAALVPDTLNVIDEVPNADVALIVSTKLAVA